ncbi:4447_t:CDS:2, partial [Entrophospora sp. SA101]
MTITNSRENEGRHPHKLSSTVINDFQTASLGVAAKAMKIELNKMVNLIQDMKAQK